MPHLVIREIRSRRPLFSGDYPDIRSCVEDAVAQGLSLQGADLSHANLSNAQLDGAHLDRACLREANMAGANLSEARLCYSVLDHAQLHSTTLCEATLTGTSLRGTLFGATDIAGAHLEACLFDTFSALELDFLHTRRLKNCGFIAGNDRFCGFSRPPLILRGLAHIVACFDHDLLLDHDAFPLPFRPQARELSSALFTFSQRHADLIAELTAIRGEFSVIAREKQVA